MIPRHPPPGKARPCPPFAHHPGRRIQVRWYPAGSYAIRKLLRTEADPTVRRLALAFLDAGRWAPGVRP
jgi:hypothetical protein